MGLSGYPFSQSNRCWSGRMMRKFGRLSPRLGIGAAFAANGAIMIAPTADRLVMPFLFSRHYSLPCHER